jgi:quercetin dioxygenase-like cupin family protein
MQTANFTNLELREAWYEHDPAMRIRVDFPFCAATGTEASSIVYFEIDPGHYLGTHTDSAEEIVLLLTGTVEATLGEEKSRLIAKQAVLIPAMVPHGIRNVGDETARCVGFFAAAEVISTFDQPMMPLRTRVVGTPPVATPVPA